MTEQTTTQRIEAAMEKYAPTGYDPASDDCTIPFAMELVEKDAEIARLRAVLLNIQSEAETGRAIDGAKLTMRCRFALTEQRTKDCGEER